MAPRLLSLDPALFLGSTLCRVTVRMSIIIPADLASHHDAALRQAARAHLTLTIRQLMIDITQDPMALAKVVTGGRDHWRRLFTKDYHTEFHLTGECDHLANVLFDFFVKHASCHLPIIVAGGAKPGWTRMSRRRR